VPLQVNSLSSTKTQLPLDYYSLPFCRPDHLRHASENLGEVLEGEITTSSPYELEMKVPEACKVLCRKVLDAKQMRLFRMAVSENYRVHWMVDNLPASMYHDQYDYYSRGFSLGFTVKGEDGQSHHYLNNHVRLIIAYHEKEMAFEGARIVGFEVVPFSIHHKYEDEEFDPAKTTLFTCNEMSPAVNDINTLQSVDGPDEIIFTYDVKWVPSELTWAHRWDVYLKGNPNEEIHYFSIVNSLMIVLFLTGVVAMIMLRTLRKDISTYNEIQTLEEAQEESGWKLVHGDVFRPPEFCPSLLAAMVGQGVQLLVMAVVVLIFALLGFLSPANRGGLLTAVLLLFVLSGSFAGYHSARLYKFFNGKNWKQNWAMTAFLLPTIFFAMFFVLDVMEYLEGSTAAISFATFVSLLLLFFGVSVPMVLAGSYYGFKKDPYQVPVRTHQIARFIPERQWYNHPALSITLGGILPFGAVCIELFFIMSALWLHQIYYVFGFLFVVLVIMVATCAEITVVMCYAQLCGEDYRWWWRSFFTSGSSALYLYLYSIWYFVTKLSITSFVSVFFYFTYMLMISIFFFLLTGCVGFLSCFWFVRKIYGAIKVD